MKITANRKVLHDYYIEDTFEAGIVLQGWEVKAIRLGHSQLKDSYVKIRDGEIWLLGCHITPILTASTHVKTDADRIKKLLLNKREINKLITGVDQKGYSIVALNLHFKGGNIKADIALAKGKKLHDKRSSEKEKELNKEKMRVLKEYRKI